MHPRVSIRKHSSISIGDRNIINKGVVIWAELKTGRDLQINPYTCIYGKVSIGDDTMIGPHVNIHGGNHGSKLASISMMDQPCITKGILIEDDVWIGAGATILDGVTIGRGSIIGAGSVVTAIVSPFSVMAGVPARLIKRRL